VGHEIEVGAAGPYHVADATVESEPPAEVWLCRCGQSRNKPHCDGSHRAAGFADPGLCAPGAIAADVALTAVRVTPLPNGPLLATGGVEVRDAGGNVVFRGAKVALCRCGQSSTKPFCDGTHRTVDFRST
jgi:CDGSH-type Zn-finger protein